jgi:putative membrane protein
VAAVAWWTATDPWAVLPWVAGAALYARLRGRGEANGSGELPAGQRLAFYGAMVAGALAFAGPLGPAAGRLLSARMALDVVLTLVVVPLGLAGIPPAWVAAWRRGPLGRAWRAVTHPIAALLVFNVLFSFLWLPPMAAAARDSWVAWATRVLLALAAVTMWWPVLNPVRGERLHPGLRLVYLFIAGLLLTPLFAYMTFNAVVLYPPYVEATRSAGIDPLNDQRLAGILMKAWALVAYGAVFVQAFREWVRQDALAGRRRRPRPPIDLAAARAARRGGPYSQSGP